MGYNEDMTPALRELEALSVSERLQLVEDLWDSIARNHADVPIPQWQKDELARRKADYLRNPESGQFEEPSHAGVTGSCDVTN